MSKSVVIIIRYFIGETTKYVKTHYKLSLTYFSYCINMFSVIKSSILWSTRHYQTVVNLRVQIVAETKMQDKFCSYQNIVHEYWCMWVWKTELLVILMAANLRKGEGEKIKILKYHFVILIPSMGPWSVTDNKLNH